MDPTGLEPGQGRGKFPQYGLSEPDVTPVGTPGDLDFGENDPFAEPAVGFGTRVLE